MSARIVPSGRSILRSAAEISLGRASVALVSLVFLGYFARVLPKPVIGLIGVQAAVVALANVLNDLGLHFQVIREATPLLDTGRDAEAVERVVGPATLVRLAASVGLTGVVAALGYAFLDELQAAAGALDMRVVLPFVCGHLLFKTAQHTLAPIFFARSRFWLQSVLDSGSAAMEKIFAFAFFVVGGPSHYFSGLMVGELLTLALAAWFLRDLIGRFRLRHLSFADARARLRAYFPHYQRVLSRRGVRQVDRLIIAGMLPLAEMANYHVARQGSQVLKHLVRGFADPLTVRMAGDKRLDAHVAARRLYHAVVVLIPMLVAASSPWLVVLLGGPAYAAAWPLMAVLAASFAFYGLSEYHLAVIAMLGSGGEAVRFEALAGVAGLTATVAMVAWLGEFGAPAGQVTHFVWLYLGGRIAMRRLVLR